MRGCAVLRRDIYVCNSVVNMFLNQLKLCVVCISRRCGGCNNFDACAVVCVGCDYSKRVKE